MNHNFITHPYPTNQSISIPPFHFQPLLPRFPTGISPLSHPVVPPVPYPVRWVPRVQPEANPRPLHGGGNTVSSWVFVIFFSWKMSFFLGRFFWLLYIVAILCMRLAYLEFWFRNIGYIGFLCVRIHEPSGHAAKYLQAWLANPKEAILTVFSWSLRSLVKRWENVKEFTLSKLDI